MIDPWPVPMGASRIETCCEVAMLEAISVPPTRLIAVAPAAPS